MREHRDEARPYTRPRMGTTGTMTSRTLRVDATGAHFEVLTLLCIAAVVYVLGRLADHTISMQATAWLKSLVVAPVIEELFFRGVVQSGLRRSAAFRGRPWLIVGATALLFAMAHLIGTSALHAALVFGPALFIGWVYERTRSVGACMALHSAANAAWLGFWSI